MKNDSAKNDQQPTDTSALDAVMAQVDDTLLAPATCAVVLAPLQKTGAPGQGRRPTLPIPPWEIDPAAPPLNRRPLARAPDHPSMLIQAASLPPRRLRPPVAPPFRIDIDQFRDDIAVPESGLLPFMVKQGDLMAYYGEWASRADAELARVRTSLTVLEAHLFDFHRKTLAAQGGRVLERAVDSAVKMDATWQAAQQAVLNAEAISQANLRMMAVLENRQAILMHLCADQPALFRDKPLES